MFKPRTFEIPLYGGDWQQRVALSEQKVAEAEKDAERGAALPRMMHETETLVDQMVNEHNALVEQAEADGCTRVTLQALGRKRWNQLVSENPPRTDETLPQSVRDGDAEIGVNDETFAEALLAESVVGTNDETPVDDLLEMVSSFQYDLLYRTAFALNRDGGRAPKALTPSPSTAETEN